MTDLVNNDRYRETDDKRYLICRECSTRSLIHTIPADEREDHDQAHDDGEFECEGHYNDDLTLTSGVGIGQATYCDGSCKR
jgi:hypothetical protein